MAMKALKDSHKAVEEADQALKEVRNSGASEGMIHVYSSLGLQR